MRLSSAMTSPGFPACLDLGKNVPVMQLSSTAKRSWVHTCVVSAMSLSTDPYSRVTFLKRHFSSSCPLRVQCCCSAHDLSILHVGSETSVCDDGCEIQFECEAAIFRRKLLKIESLRSESRSKNALKDGVTSVVRDRVALCRVATHRNAYLSSRF